MTGPTKTVTLRRRFFTVHLGLAPVWLCVCRATLSLTSSTHTMLDGTDAAAELVPPLLAAAGVAVALVAALRRPAFGRVSVGERVRDGLENALFRRERETKRAVKTGAVCGATD